MKILLDHNAPRGLARHLPGHEVRHTSELGWDKVSNGDLLRLAESNGYQIMITADRSLPWQQSLSSRSLGVVTLSTNNWPLMQPHIPAIAASINRCAPGTVTTVLCGTFVPRRFRNREDTEV